MLLLLLLPFQQTLHTLHHYYLPINIAYYLLVFLHLHAKLINTTTKLLHVHLVPIMLLFITISASALLAEEAPAVAF